MNRDFQSIVDSILEETWEFYPSTASGAGLHDYDGRLPQITAESLARRAADLDRMIGTLSGVDASSLGLQERTDLRVLESALRKELFELTELRALQTDPMQSLWHIEFTNYVKRDYAPLAERVEALTAALKAVPAYLDGVRDLLDPVIGRGVLDVGIESYDGMKSFYDEDLRETVSSLEDDRLGRRFQGAREAASAAVGSFAEHLRSLQETASDDFALGPAKFSGLLRLGEMVDMHVDRLLEVGAADLARNLDRFRVVCSAIDRTRSPKEVMARVAADHPTAEGLISETGEMLERIREFVIEHEIVSVPSEVRCTTTETPAFMRWAFAAMDLPGPFEERATEAFYYVTPVDPKWSEEQQEEWLTSFNYPSLRNISVHEAYPGHYLHHLHTLSAPSKVSQVFGAYSFWEGWGHYVEEMMVEQGFTEGDPRAILGQLGDALLRNCRYVCAIKMHTQGMTIEEATRFFVDNAYMEELPASKEALRGTFDPMYLNYTLGKLMILKLREDYRREKGRAFSLREFHDTLLSFGAPPLPLVRELMLKEPGTEVV